MDKSSKEKLAASSYALLEPFHTVAGHALREVAFSHSDNDISAIYLTFDAASLHITVDPEDDTVEVKLAENLPHDIADASHLQPWKKYITSVFVCGWIGVNQQGYVDTASLSFGGIVPDISITALASSLQISSHVNHSTKLHHVHTQVAA